MTNDEMKALTANAFEESDNTADKDAVMELMFSKGVPFGKLQILYKTVGITDGYIPDPAVVKADVLDRFDEDESDISELGEWDLVETYIDSVAESVNGATEAFVLRSLRTYCKATGIELPKKSSKKSARKRGGAVLSAVVDYVNGTEEIDLQGMYEAIRPVVKAPKNAVYYVGVNFVLSYCIKFGVTIPEANAAMSRMTQLNLEALETIDEQ